MFGELIYTSISNLNLLLNVCDPDITNNNINFKDQRSWARSLFSHIKVHQQIRIQKHLNSLEFQNVCANLKIPGLSEILSWSLCSEAIASAIRDVLLDLLYIGSD